MGWFDPMMPFPTSIDRILGVAAVTTCVIYSHSCLGLRHSQRALSAAPKERMFGSLDSVNVLDCRSSHIVSALHHCSAGTLHAGEEDKKSSCFLFMQSLHSLGARLERQGLHYTLLSLYTSSFSSTTITTPTYKCFDLRRCQPILDQSWASFGVENKMKCL